MVLLAAGVERLGQRGAYLFDVELGNLPVTLCDSVHFGFPFCGLDLSAKPHFCGF
jgi:hypothetical protein